MRGDHSVSKTEACACFAPFQRTEGFCHSDNRAAKDAEGAGGRGRRFPPEVRDPVFRPSNTRAPKDTRDAASLPTGNLGDPNLYAVRGTLTSNSLGRKDDVNDLTTTGGTPDGRKGRKDVRTQGRKDYSASDVRT